MDFKLNNFYEISKKIFFNQTPIHVAIEEEYPDIVDLLLDYEKIDPNVSSILT